MAVHNSCCVVNCKNTGRNSNCKFYTFPRASWKLEKRKKWINAVKRKNPDGSPWTPKPTDTICSDHFIGGQKSEEEASPSYIPVIFPTIYKKQKVNERTSLSRYTRFLNRGKAKKDNIRSPIITNTKRTSQNNYIKMGCKVMIDVDSDENEKIDKDCQVFFLSDLYEVGRTFICNRYMCKNDKKCDAEIQTEIIDMNDEMDS
ncbi:hypothetical protein PV327_001855 [Microctonus hyperodae]|uniref:THAP-type domain-containing protein n=1 Tax=Microctonus hyperodae TaxID=165561 RepID=A0AA39FEI7_MICHY|nr:hypothetical protein PV327_001855 [Microctonus hyperodae]